MAALVIKNLPDEIHERLRSDALRHRWSMTQQAIFILEQALPCVRPVPAFKAYQGKFLLTNDIINAAKREGRP